jgi:DNA-directed RNA polymerase subunit RPC12/RpoP
MKNYRCPYCDSSNTVKISLIHEDGISITKGVAFLGNDAALYSHKTQTNRSKNTAPPKEQSMLFTVFVTIMARLWELKWYLLTLAILTDVLKTIMQLLVLAVTGKIIGTDVSMAYCGNLVLIWLAWELYKLLPEIKQDLRNTKRYNLNLGNTINQYHRTYECQRCGSEFSV